jgi:hypothetical protein
LPKQLGLDNFEVIEASPDKPNIYLDKHRKEAAVDVLCEYENCVYKLCDELFEKKEEFPVTLVFFYPYFI